MTPKGFRTSTIHNVPVTPKVAAARDSTSSRSNSGVLALHAEGDLRAAQGLRNTLRGRIDDPRGQGRPRRLWEHAKELTKAKRIMLRPGHGAARRDDRRVPLRGPGQGPAVAEYASEFRYRNPIIEENTVVVAVSQSGETADTLAALIEAKDRGALALGVINVVGSSMARETDAGVYLRVGPEIGVASPRPSRGRSRCSRSSRCSWGAGASCRAEQCAECSASCETDPRQDRADPGRTTHPQGDREVLSIARTGSSWGAGTTIRRRWRARSSSRKSRTSTPRACPPRR
jgi:hypothetical protein